MEWDDLKYLLAVARTGNLVAAARQLRTSASTVARRIAELEAAIEARLFDRKQTGYTLTETGEAIRLRAEEVEERVLALQREALGRDAQITGKVRVTASDDIATHVIAPQLPRFARAYPQIALDLTAQMELANLARREADIAIRGQRPTEGDFVARQIGTWPFGLYAAKSYAKSRRLKPGLTDLNGVDIITWTEEYAHLRGGPWFAKHMRNAPVALASNSRRVHHEACKAGMGVAILPCAVADKERGLLRLLGPDRVLSLQLWLVVHRDLTRTARVRAVMDFLIDVGRKHAPAG
ncbi:MAG TPA: LysR family transcriptional regulator [Pseudolabrys sp.]|nr:LysR family transcriptional regulator [Pseudolabrys sp.]